MPGKQKKNRSFDYSTRPRRFAGLDQNGEHEQNFSRNLETEELDLLNTFIENIEINKYGIMRYLWIKPKAGD
jgi:hypothetical protein